MTVCALISLTSTSQEENKAQTLDSEEEAWKSNDQEIKDNMVCRNKSSRWGQW